LWAETSAPMPYTGEGVEVPPAGSGAGEEAGESAARAGEAAVVAGAGAAGAGAAGAAAATAEAPSEVPTRVAEVKEPRSPLRKFVYLLVALMPFVAFILLLPRGGEVEEEQASPTPEASTPTRQQAAQLAFPYDFSEEPVEPTEAPEVVDMQEPVRQCSDGVDNDRDRRTDYPADTGCSSRSDNSEGAAPARTTAAPPPPPPPGSPSPPPPPPPPPPPTDEPDDDQDTDPPPPLDNDNGGPACEPGDPGFPNCDGAGNDEEEPVAPENEE
ncbi:MAG TPA: hypothetical protein VHJ78_10410, partial [Actinomycetota bacterium]|nr:hypothetical protein [Actinomycetota bacterium]